MYQNEFSHLNYPDNFIFALKYGEQKMTGNLIPYMYMNVLFQSDTYLQTHIFSITNHNWAYQDSIFTEGRENFKV